MMEGMLANWLDDVKAALLEFVGTTTFLLLAFGGIQAANAEVESSSGDGANNIIHAMYIALAMGFSLLIAVWIFYRASGGVFNPNVSLALFLTGIIGPFRFVLYCIAQLVGGIVAAALVLALTPGHLQCVYVCLRRQSSLFLTELQYIPGRRREPCASGLHRDVYHHRSRSLRPHVGGGEASRHPVRSGKTVRHLRGCA